MKEMKGNEGLEVEWEKKKIQVNGNAIFVWTLHRNENLWWNNTNLINTGRRRKGKERRRKKLTARISPAEGRTGKQELKENERKRRMAEGGAATRRQNLRIEPQIYETVACLWTWPLWLIIDHFIGSFINGRDTLRDWQGLGKGA